MRDELARAVELAPARVGGRRRARSLAFGFGPVRKAFNPPGVTRGFGWLGDLLAAPAARWDAAWYLVIAHYGYRPDLGASPTRAPPSSRCTRSGLRAISWLGVPPVLAGVLLSVAALALALTGSTADDARAGARAASSVAGRASASPTRRAWR